MYVHPPRRKAYVGDILKCFFFDSDEAKLQNVFKILISSSVKFCFWGFCVVPTNLFEQTHFLSIIGLTTLLNILFIFCLFLINKIISFSELCECLFKSMTTNKFTIVKFNHNKLNCQFGNTKFLIKIFNHSLVSNIQNNIF